MPVQLLARSYPLLPHKQDVDQTLYVAKEDECGLNGKRKGRLLGKLNKELVAQEGQVANDDKTDHLVAHREDSVSPHHNQAPNCHAND